MLAGTRRWSWVAALVATVLAVPAAAASTGRSCGVIHAHVPYSHNPHGGKSWRVHVSGQASCRTAEQTLDAVMHLHGIDHYHGLEANSFWTYKGWTCPYGQMGVQTCYLGPAAKPRAEAYALTGQG